MFTYVVLILSIILGLGSALYLWLKLPVFKKLAEVFSGDLVVSLSESEKAKLSKKLIQWQKNFGLSLIVHVVIFIILFILLMIFGGHVDSAIRALTVLASLISLAISMFAVGLSTVKF